MFLPPSAQPSRKDVAEFLRLGLQRKLIAATAINAWADSIIESEDEPPLWAIDLSLAAGDQKKMLLILLSIPGVVTDLLPIEMLMAIVRRKWVAGLLSGRDVADMSHLLPEDWSSTAYVFGLTQFYHIYFECLDTGHSLVTEAQADRMVDEFLQPYQAFEAIVPPLVLNS